MLGRLFQRLRQRRAAAVPEVEVVEAVGVSELDTRPSLLVQDLTATDSSLYTAASDADAVAGDAPSQADTAGLVRVSRSRSQKSIPSLLFVLVLLSIAAAFWSIPKKGTTHTLGQKMETILSDVQDLASHTGDMIAAGAGGSLEVVAASSAVVEVRDHLETALGALKSGNADAARRSVEEALKTSDDAGWSLQRMGAQAVSNREAQLSLQNDVERVSARVRGLGRDYVDESSTSTTLDRVVQGWFLAATVLALVLALHQWRSGVQGQAEVDRVRLRALEDMEKRRALAQEQEMEARRINEATQAAILRLMNELQLVAEGDLTHETTVTEDVTGAIADSINYTVEELRNLVGQVQGVVERVTSTTAQVESTSLELLSVSNEQLREIRETGQAVLDMSTRITEVSNQAQGSAEAARQALQAAELGARAVQETIGGMNTIREQIQDTSKRIKRLGESSQEIGEITELISEITEQTNVLALNAAIQAAAAGEAGRGFSVVAEEVQRLAERSADATRQISTLVRAIQADTQDAVHAMEISTREVVEGARLSDNAGAALADIDRLSRQVAELIQKIAQSSAREAEHASETAGNIQHIFAVTEQTGEGTRSTVQQVRELTRVADELRQSVARFKIA